jgi:hypothetical protein
LATIQTITSRKAMPTPFSITLPAPQDRSVGKQPERENPTYVLPKVTEVTTDYLKDNILRNYAETRQQAKISICSKVG